jgi:hypothetical protein
MSGMTNFLVGMGLGITQPRDKAITTVVGDLTIDTVQTFDTNRWETGIKHGSNWYIVETYDDEDDAHEGHDRWVINAPTTPLERLKELDEHNSDEWWG